MAPAPWEVRYMLTKIHDAGDDRAENASSSLYQDRQVYSLDAIIALQKALEGGVPEGMVEYLPSRQPNFPRERRRLSDRRKAVPLMLQNSNSSLLARMLRLLFSAANSSADVSRDGSFAQNAW
jgi:hypothetical protein